MSLFKNEKLDKVNEQLSKLESKRDEIQKAIEEMETALAQTVELYAIGQIDDKDIEEAHGFLKERRQELADVEQMIAKVKDVRKKVAFETIPLVKEARQKKLDEIDKEWYSKVKELKKAQAEVYLILAEMGKIRGKANSVVEKYGLKLKELGEEEKYWIVGTGKSDAFREIRELPLNPNPGYFGQDEATEMGYSIPEYAVRDAMSGYLPKWAKEITEDNK